MGEAVTANNFMFLRWGLASVGYVVNPRGKGPYHKISPANLRYDEMTLDRLRSSKQVKNPLHDKSLLIICKFCCLTVL
jgi:hypothetical protein